uniref:Uncharacterized protein n=1 Tax=Vannella robusta TaxID=1487602 RepID=A0A7S4M7L6_9EUKA
MRLCKVCPRASVSFCFSLFSLLSLSLACSLEVTIGGTECSDSGLCTIIQGLNTCLFDTKCDSFPVITCVITVQGEISGEGNSNLVFDAASKIDELSIILEGDVTLDGGFFIHVSNNAFTSLQIQSPGTTVGIFGASETCFSYTSDNENSFVRLRGIEFLNATTTDGTPPAMVLDTPGTIDLPLVGFSNTQSSGDCGAASIQLYPTTSMNDQPAAYFEDTVAAGQGGGLCLYGSVGTNVSFAMPDFMGSHALNRGGGIYIKGPGSFHISSILGTPSVWANNGSLIYAEDFDLLRVSDSDYTLSGRSTGITASEAGGIYAQSFRPGAAVEVERLVVRGSTMESSGGALYIEGVETANIQQSYFAGCSATYGYGGAILFNGVDTIEVQESEFASNRANSGASLACIGGSSTAHISDVMFIGDVLYDIYGPDEELDIYSDGSCTDSFWYSQSPCPQKFACSSCADSVCGTSSLKCFCYCDSESCSGPSSSPSPAPSFENFPTNTVVAVSVSIDEIPSSYDEDTEQSGLSTLWIVVLSLLGVMFAIMFVVLIGLLLVFGKHKKAKMLEKYQVIDTQSPDTPQREDDGIYHHTD